VKPLPYRRRLKNNFAEWVRSYCSVWIEPSCDFVPVHLEISGRKIGKRRARNSITRKDIGRLNRNDRQRALTELTGAIPGRRGLVLFHFGTALR